MVALPHLGLLDDVRHVFSLDADGCFESFAALFCPLCTRTAIETSIIQGVTGHCFATLATGRFSVGNRQRVESWGLPDAGILSRQFRESGKPLEGWFLAPFRLIPSFDGRIAAGKMAGMACWIGSLLAMHACLRRLARLDGPVALTISGIAVAAPVYEVLGDVSLAMYPACMLLFWCGWLLFAAAINCRGSVAIACRVAAVALLFLSFNVNSLLVMRSNNRKALSSGKLGCKPLLTVTVLPATGRLRRQSPLRMLSTTGNDVPSAKSSCAQSAGKALKAW